MSTTFTFSAAQRSAASSQARGWRLEVEVPPDSPFFEGHFPGAPVLPAVAQLELLRQAWRQIDTATPNPHLAASHVAAPELEGIDNLRLALPLGPGDRLALDLAEPAESGVSAFRLSRGGEEVSRGSLRWRPATAAAEPASGESAPARSPRSADDRDQPSGLADPSPPGEITRRLPHRGRALLVRRVVERRPERLLAAGAFPADGPFVRGASTRGAQVPAFLALELAAQCAALLDEEPTGEEAAAGPRIGYLVRLRRAHLASRPLPVEVPLEVEISALGGSGDLRMFHARVTLDGDEVARGDLTTVVTEERLA